MSGVPKFAAGNADSKPYWAAAAAGQLVFKRCLDCGHIQYPPRYVCPKCWSDKAEWVANPGAGTVHSFTVVHRSSTAYHADKVPFVVAVVDVENGPRMITNIVGENALDVSIGDRVQVTFEARDGGTLPQFRRVQ